MSKKILSWLLGVMLFAPTLLKAQEADIFYYNPFIPQAVHNNPAMHNAQRKVVIGLAGFSGFYGDLSSDASISDMLYITDEGTTTFDFAYLAGNLDGDGAFDETFNLPLLFFGLNLDRNHFYLSLNEKQAFSGFMNQELVAFLDQGNAPYVGRTISPEMDMTLYQYSELALGYSRDFMDDKLHVGVALKGLFGKAALKSQNVRMDIYTHPDLEWVDFTAKGSILAAGPIGFEVEEGGEYIEDINFTSDFSPSYFTNFSNPGFGIDIGATYQVNPKIGVAASITDIGSINWKGDGSGVEFGGLFKWQGADISNLFDEDFTFIKNGTSLIDSLKQSITVSEKQASFKTPLATKLYLGGTFTVNEKLELGVLNRVQFTGSGDTRNMFMLSANAAFSDVLSLNGTYAIAKDSYDNLGLGFAVRAGFAQFVLGTGNIINLMRWDKAKYTSVRFGINFMFGKLTDDKELLKEEIDESL